MIKHLLAELVIGAFDEPELLQRHTNALQHCFDHILIVAGSKFQKFPWGFHVIQVCVKVCKQNCYLDIEIKGHQNVNLCKYLQTRPPCPAVVKSLFWPFPESSCLVYNISSYLTSCFQEVRDLRHRHKISNMWLACGCCSPVNFKFPLLQYLLQLLFPQNLLLWKQKSWFNAGASLYSSFTL